MFKFYAPLINAFVILLATSSLADADANPTHDSSARNMKIETAPFGNLDDGTKVEQFTLTNRSGASVTLSGFGATLVRVQVPDRDGKIDNVNIGFDNLDAYVAGHPYFGATVGRYANRIGNAEFTIDGKTFSLTKNHGEHMLHGGEKNFAYQVWDAKTHQDDRSVGVIFSLHSPAGDNGFPGNVDVTCDYVWNDENELIVSFTGTTDAATHLSLTNHSYFNLGGIGSGKVYDHIAEIPSTQTLSVDEDLIPTGGFSDVEGTPFDFRTPTAIGKRIDQLPATKGYDHCYVVPGNVGTLRHAASITDPASGRTLAIETTLPGMQLYTANHLGGGASNAGQSQHEAFCVECQSFPNSPNIDSFPSTLVRPGETMTAKTVHRFGVK